MDNYGIVSILPVFTILVVAVSTRRTLFAMVCGLSVGALILAGGITGFIVEDDENLFFFHKLLKII